MEAARSQLEGEFRILHKEERQKLLYHSDFAVELTTEDSLAMKANLALPWNKLRINENVRKHSLSFGCDSHYQCFLHVG